MSASGACTRFDFDLACKQDTALSHSLSAAGDWRAIRGTQSHRQVKATDNSNARF